MELIKYFLKSEIFQTKGVKLMARGPDMLCAGHVHPAFQRRGGGVAIHHMIQQNWDPSQLTGDSLKVTIIKYSTKQPNACVSNVPTITTFNNDTSCCTNLTSPILSSSKQNRIKYNFIHTHVGYSDRIFFIQQLTRCLHFKM